MRRVAECMHAAEMNGLPPMHGWHRVLMLIELIGLTWRVLKKQKCWATFWGSFVCWAVLVLECLLSRRNCSCQSAFQRCNKCNYSSRYWMEVAQSYLSIDQRRLLSRMVIISWEGYYTMTGGQHNIYLCPISDVESIISVVVHQHKVYLLCSTLQFATAIKTTVLA